MAAATKVELEKNRFFRILLRFLRLQVNHNLTTVNMRDSRPRRRPRRRFYDRRALISRAGNGTGIYGGSVALSSTKSWRSVLTPKLCGPPGNSLRERHLTLRIGAPSRPELPYHCLAILQGRMSVFILLGTSPTGITAVSFLVLASIAETDAAAELEM